MSLQRMLQQKKEEVETRNQADQLVYATEKGLKDVGDKISAEEKAKIEGHLLELKNAIKSESIDEIKKKMETLAQASHKMAEEMYKKAQAESAAEAASDAGASASSSSNAENSSSAESPGEGNNDDVIDAEFKEE